MKEYAKGFYKSKSWQKCRGAYASSVGGLCERCKKKGLIKAGVIVHHKKPITPANIYDPDITLNFNNLELLCRDCHAEVHKGPKRYKVDAMGRITAWGD